MDSGNKPTIESDDWYPREAVAYIYRGKGSCIFPIDYNPDWGIHGAFAEALHKHARCSTCGAPPPADFSPCPCGGDQSSELSLYSVSEAVWRNELESPWKKDRRRVYDWSTRKARREAIQESDEPPHSQADIALLREIQNGACYYCGTSISRNFTVDHLEPLAYGGSNGVRNIMLACADCNRRKWTLSEAQFWQRLRKRLPATQFNRVREAAKVMKRQVRRRLRERN